MLLIEEELVVKPQIHEHTLDRMGTILKKYVFLNSLHNVQPHPALSQRSFVALVSIRVSPQPRKGLHLPT